ncbi:MAG: hypothetical protein ACPLXP_00075 [Microgenomates group bacterium]
MFLDEKSWLFVINLWYLGLGVLLLFVVIIAYLNTPKWRRKERKR